MSVKEETPQQAPNEQDKKSKSQAVYIVIILLLLGGIGYLGFKTKTTSEKLVQTTIVLTETSNEKNLYLERLDSLYGVYESLKTENDSTNSLIELKQAEIKKLYSSLNRAKTANKAELDKYKQEIASMEAILKANYFVIDSLNSANVYLADVNTQLLSTLEEAKKIDDEKTQELEKLSEKVERAAVLKANNVISVPLSSKGKPIFKAKKVVKITTSCTIAENGVIEPGTITVYVRITRKDGVVLTASQNNTLVYDGEEILFSEKRELSYQNKDTKCEIFYKASESELSSGTYKVQLFAQGKEIGNTNFVLN